VFFDPATVAVFVGSEAPDSVGRAVMANLIRNPFGGTVFPVGPQRSHVLGVKAYPVLAAVPLPVELALVAAPAPAVPAVLAECAAAGARGAVVLSDGFRECDPGGPELLREVREEVRHTPLRVLGPNSRGVACSRTGFNATVAPAPVPPGKVGFISQGGGLLSALVGGGLPEGVGCSAFLSVGAMIDVGWADCLEYLGDDPQTELIGIYLEVLADAPAFFEAARKVTPRKPVLVVQGGRAAAAALAAAGRDEFLEEAFRRAGVLRVDTLADLLRTAEMLATQPTPRGRRLMILSNARSPAVVAADALVAEGGEPARLAPATVASLDALLPFGWDRRNPIDIGGVAVPELFGQAAAVAARDPNCDGLLAVLAPQATADPVRAAEELASVARMSGKPVLASWLWGAASPASLAPLSRAGIPAFSCPNMAVRAFAYLWRHGENLRDLAEDTTPAVAADEPPPDRALAGRIMDAARRSGRTLLAGGECLQLLRAYSLPVVEPRTARAEAEAVDLAGAMGYPVVLQLRVEGGGPESTLGGVQLPAGDAAAVRRAYRTLALIAREEVAPFRGVRVQPAAGPGDYEIMLGSTTHPQVGPVLQLGARGSRPGVPGGRVVALPPLNTTLVRQLIEQAALFTAVGAPRRSEWVDLAAFEQLLTRFSRLVVEARWLQEITLDPLLASPQRLVIVDARAVLHGPDAREEQLPAPPFAAGGRP
jgi:acetyltransferase